MQREGLATPLRQDTAIRKALEQDNNSRDGCNSSRRGTHQQPLAIRAKRPQRREHLPSPPRRPKVCEKRRPASNHPHRAGCPLRSGHKRPRSDDAHRHNTATSGNPSARPVRHQSTQHLRGGDGAGTPTRTSRPKPAIRTIWQGVVSFHGQRYELYATPPIPIIRYLVQKTTRAVRYVCRTAPSVCIK